jgi:hypothetical protein
LIKTYRIVLNYYFSHQFQLKILVNKYHLPFHISVFSVFGEHDHQVRVDAGSAYAWIRFNEQASWMVSCWLRVVGCGDLPRKVATRVASKVNVTDACSFFFYSLALHTATWPKRTLRLHTHVVPAQSEKEREREVCIIITVICAHWRATCSQALCPHFSPISANNHAPMSTQTWAKFATQKREKLAFAGIARGCFHNKGNFKSEAYFQWNFLFFAHALCFLW